MASNPILGFTISALLPVLACPRCGGRLCVIASAHDPLGMEQEHRRGSGALVRLMIDEISDAWLLPSKARLPVAIS